MKPAEEVIGAVGLSTMVVRPGDTCVAMGISDLPILPMAEVTTSYYLRLAVADQAGVLAEITRILAAHDVSIDALLQKEAAEGESQTDLVILTHETKEKNLMAALSEIQDLKTVMGEIVKIRLENLS